MKPDKRKLTARVRHKAQGATSASTKLQDIGTSVIEFDDNRLAKDLFGEHDRHLVCLESLMNVALSPRGNRLQIQGAESERARAETVLRRLYADLARGRTVDQAAVEAAVRLHGEERPDEATVKTPRRLIAPRSPAQARYLEALERAELVLALGPAGTGKTYLAVAAGVALMMQGRVDRLILSRPAVEAGERLGFLPGDMREKVDPYLRPLYDALHDMLPADTVQAKLMSGEIEVAPLAFMRGRTLAHAFVILDEAQNSTPMQMKMFLTRLGEHSRMVVTGDPTQVDLPPGIQSGLADACALLEGVEGVATARFTERDVVRHPLVTRIVAAYNARDAARSRAGARHIKSGPERNGPEREEGA